MKNFKLTLILIVFIFFIAPAFADFQYLIEQVDKEKAELGYGPYEPIVDKSVGRSASEYLEELQNNYNKN